MTTTTLPNVGERRHFPTGAILTLPAAIWTVTHVSTDPSNPWPISVEQADSIVASRITAETWAKGSPFPTEGTLCIILRSGCCDADMTGVEYGDHQACRRCKETDREWIHYLAPYRDHLYRFHRGELIDMGPGPDGNVRDLYTGDLDEAKAAGYHWWG